MFPSILVNQEKIISIKKLETYSNLW